MGDEPSTFAVVDVSDWEIDRLETIGGEAKVWLGEPETGQKWLFKPSNFHPEGVSRITDDRVARVVAAVPEMSDVAATFVAQVVAANRRRVLDVC
jgi:hypothetical protein